MALDQTKQEEAMFIRVNGEALILLLKVFMDGLALDAGGKEASKKRFLEELQSPAGLSEELTAELIGYAVHHNDRKMAEELARTFRKSHALNADELGALAAYESLHKRALLTRRYSRQR